jgi:hypothetical protein
MSMPMRIEPFTLGPTCTCSPPNKKNWKQTRFVQGTRTIECEIRGNSWNESDPGNDPRWKNDEIY